MSVRPLRSLLSQQAIVVTLPPFIIVAVLTYFWLLPQIRAEIESRQSELASLVAGQVENYLATAEGTVKGVAAIHLNEDLDWHHVQHVLDAQIKASPALQALYVVGTDGRIIVSGLAERNRGQREDLHGLDLTHTTIFTQVERLRQPVWSDTFLSAVTGKITAAVAIPSHGVTVIGEIDPDRLSQFLTKTGTKEEQLILIIDQRGEVVVDQSGVLTAQKLNLNNIPLVKKGTGSAALVSGQFKINDRAMFGTISENPAVKWDILVGRPLDVLYRSALTTMIIFLSGLFAALLLSTSAALYMARRLAVQFEELANHARKLSLGKIVTGWPKGSVTEVEQLANDLSMMADAISAQERQLAESENLLHSVIDHTFHFQGILSADGKVIDINKSACDLVGLSKEAVVGCNFWDTRWWQHDPTVQEKVHAAVESCAVHAFVRFWTTHLDASGKIHHIDFSLKSMRDDDNKVLYLIFEGDDITSIVRIKGDLRASEARLQLYFQRLPIASIVWGKYYDVQQWNPAAEKLFGYSAAEALGRRADELILLDTEKAETDQIWRQILAEELTVNSVNDNRTKDGKIITCAWTNTPFYDPQGQATGVISVVEDITEKIKFEEELKHNVTMFQTLYELSLMSEESDQVILDYCLEAAVRITRSAIGYIYFMNEDEMTLTLHAWPKDVMPACSIPFKPTVYQVAETGLWGEAARRRSPVITNDYEAPDPLRRGYPQGHVPIKRHMNIPLIIHGKIVLLAGVGNKEGEYDEFDIKALTLLMTAIWRMIEANKVEKSLQESEEIFRQMFAQNYDAVILFHPKKLRIIDANAEALALYGLRLEELRKIRPRGLIDSKDFKIFAKNIMPYRDAEAFILTKATCYKASGEKIFASLKGKMIKLKNEEMVLCSIRDITQKLRLEEEIKTTQAKLIQTNKMTSLGMLVSGVAHEINNPNHCISINASVLKNIWGDVSPLVQKPAGNNDSALLGRPSFDEVQTLVPQLFSGISESSQRISTIVTNMREFVRNGQNSRAGSFDVNKIITSAASILWNHINRHTDSFSSALAENIPLTYGNAQQIEQVVINLLMNALQALPDKSHGVSITTLLDPTVNNVVIMIADEGKGMTPITLERLAEPFFTTREDEGGTGLGLYISMSIIKDYGGSLDFDSELGKGTTATIRLPIATDSQIQHL